MRRIVVDASVILKWVVGDEREPDQAKARLLLKAWVEGRVEISAPALWKFEVGNFLGRELPSEEAMYKMELLINLNIGSVDLSEEMCGQCFAWMKAHRVTFYDACYLAAAHEIEADLVTSDEKFTKKMEKRERIRLLKDIAL